MQQENLSCPQFLKFPKWSKTRSKSLPTGFDFVTPNNIPTRGIDGLVAYNGFRGIHTWLHNRDSGGMEGTFTFPTFLAHDFRSTIENYTIWNVQSGVQNFYSTRFDFLNGLIVGDVDSPVPYFASPGQQANNSSGIGVSHNFEEANSNLFNGLRLEGFEYGFQVFSPFNEQRQEITPYATSELRNASLANVEYAFSPTNRNNPDSQADRFSDLFILDEASVFNTLGSATNLLPTAAFEFSPGEGISVALDAAASFDSDPSPEVRAADDGIVAYAWDLDGNSLYDDGATSTTSQVIAATANPCTNSFLDSDFSAYARSKFIFAEEKELPTQFPVLVDWVFADYLLDRAFPHS